MMLTFSILLIAASVVFLVDSVRVFVRAWRTGR